MAGLGSLMAADMTPDESCPLQCFNRGKCVHHNLTNEFYCDCPLTQVGGFMGIHCETPFLECTDGERRGWRCLNGGMCQSGDTAEVCHCPDEFVGSRCETFTGPSEVFPQINNINPVAGVDSQFSAGAIFAMAMAGLVLAFACFLAGFLAGNRRRLFVEFDTNCQEQSEPSNLKDRIAKSKSEIVNMESEIVDMQQDNEPPELPKDLELT